MYAPEYAPLQKEAVVESETPAERLVTRSVGELKPHPSYARHNLSVEAFKLGALEEQGERAFSYPLLVTRDRYIIDGYSRWELAKQKGRPTLECIERALTAEEALEELIWRHRRSHGLADFVRIELALDLDSYFKDKALLNRRAGGRLKGLSKLTGPEKVNSRAEIARIAQVSVGNVHKVKYILAHACSALKESARAVEISINLAEKWCHEPDAKQLENLRLLRIMRGIKRKARNLVAAELVQAAKLKRDEQVIRLSDLVALVNRLATIAPERSKEFGSIEIKVIDGPGREIFLTEELIRVLTPQQGMLVT